MWECQDPWVPAWQGQTGAAAPDTAAQVMSNQRAPPPAFPRDSQKADQPRYPPSFLPPTEGEANLVLRSFSTVGLLNTLLEENTVPPLWRAELGETVF